MQFNSRATKVKQKLKKTFVFLIPTRNNRLNSQILPIKKTRDKFRITDKTNKKAQKVTKNDQHRNNGNEKKKTNLQLQFEWIFES